MSGKVEEIEQEREYYPVIRDKLEQLLTGQVDDVHLEITAGRTISETLKAQIPSGREIIFDFVKRVGPDITGYVKRPYWTDFIVVEVKTKKIVLDHIYQTRKYRDLFEARFALLVSTQPIPQEIKRLAKTTVMLLHTPSIHHYFVLTHFDKDSNEFTDWYPENPFDRDLFA